MNKSYVCHADCATTHIILRDKIFFLDLTLTNVNVSTISCIINLIEGSERVNIMLPNRTIFHINYALYFRKSTNTAQL